VISRPACVVRLDASSPRVSAALLLRYDSARNGHSERVDSAPDGSLQADCWAASRDDWPRDDCSEVDSALDDSLQADCWAASVDDWPQDDCSEQLDSAPGGSLQADCWAASVLTDLAQARYQAGPGPLDSRSQQAYPVRGKARYLVAGPVSQHWTEFLVGP